MNNPSKKLVTWTLAAALLAVAGTAGAAPVLIAHPGVTADALEAGQVQNIFLGKTAQWDDGTRVTLAMLKGGDVSDAFLKANVKKSQRQFETFWKKAVFSGTGEMPAAFDTEAELVAFVAATPGAVGYIDSATPHDSVKEVAVK